MIGRALPFQVDDDPGAPLFLRIARAVIRDIERGRLRPGGKLPGTRSLASELGVHRNTVVAAYDELALQGWISVQPSRGAVVALDLPDPDPGSGSGQLSLKKTKPQHSEDQAAPAQSASHLGFSDGTPDPRLLPRDELARAFRRALGSNAFLAPSGYGDPRGSLRLRVALAEWLTSTRALAVGPDDVLLTRGSQMALFLAARAVASSGEAIAVETPGYPLAWAAFRAAGMRIVGVPVDQDGIDVEALTSLAKRDRGIRAVLVTPHHQYPTTTTLGAGRRIGLLRLAAERGWTVIEDDYDHEYRYEGRPVLPLAASSPLSAPSPVVYVGSLSKMLAPGLRLGYAVARRAVLQTMGKEREAIDRQGDVPLEQAIAELIQDGELRRHTRKARRIYLERRDVLVGALRRELGDSVSFDVPAGGLAIWARVREDLDAGLWATRALERGLSVSNGARFSLEPNAGPNAFRLGFAALNPDELAMAVRRLAEAKPATGRSAPA